MTTSHKTRPFQFGLGALFVLTAAVAIVIWTWPLAVILAAWLLQGWALWALVVLLPRRARNRNARLSAERLAKESGIFPNR